MTTPNNPSPRGRPRSAVGTVSVHLRLTPDVAERLLAIGRTRPELQYGGHPSPAKVVAWLVEQQARKNPAQGGA